MAKTLRSLAFIFLFSCAAAGAQSQRLSPGSRPYTPTRIEWLTTTLQASLRADSVDLDKYILQITSPDPETILIYVRYMPSVNREAMNIGIDAARRVIKITAKSHGWDKWLRVQEDVQLATSESER